MQILEIILNPEEIVHSMENSVVYRKGYSNFRNHFKLQGNCPQYERK